MSYNNDYWSGYSSRATTTVHTDTPSAKVTYSNGTHKFSVIVRQKPNPIGFHARLPGDAK